ncbi:DUF89 domain-containing protein [Saccharicrinis sp. FJH62]|uniref:damage-control phosphatase ARMT1 family protein n=1 Tax=Saccharicrinis sp. FJH62 TaxID=3344657 RepID=UPI0035D47609
MRQECYSCHMKTVHHLLDKFKPEDDDARIFTARVHSILKANDLPDNPCLATRIQRAAKEHFKINDLYAHEKFRINEELLRDYKYWKSIVENSDDPFLTAARLSVVGNIIDFGAHTVKADIRAQVHTLLTKDLVVNKVRQLKEHIRHVQSVVFLGDNCGEIVFDKLFIETFYHPNVTYVVRGEPVLNDVTTEDAFQVRMQDVCRVITNGYDAPSTLVQYCSTEFLEIFNSADLIISKGQGNFEGLMDSNNPNIYFMLIAKCDPVARLLKVKKNDMVITTLTPALV